MNRSFLGKIIGIALLLAILTSGTVIAFVYITIRYPLLGAFLWLTFILTLVLIGLIFSQADNIQLILSQKTKRITQEQEQEKLEEAVEFATET